jgi:O-antigen ligase
MSERPSAAATVARNAGVSLLWLGLGGMFLAALTLAVSQGIGHVALALLLASLCGVLILVRPEWGVFALTSTFFLSYPEALQGAGKLTINNVLGLVLAAILVMRFVIDRRTDIFDSREVRLLGVISFIIVVNLLFVGDVPPLGRFEALDLTDERLHDVLSKLAYLVFLVAFVRRRWHVAVLASAFVGFVLLTAPNAVWNALSGWSQPVKDIETIRAAADTGIVAARNSNRLAFVSVVAIAFIGFAMREFRGRLLRIAGAAAIGLLVVTVFLSASRSGLLNLLIVGGVFASRLRIRLRTVLSGGLVAISLAAVVLSLVPLDSLSRVIGSDQAIRGRIASVSNHTSIPQAYLERITDFFLPQRADSGVSESTQARLDLVQVGLRMFADHPFVGVGIGDFRWVSIMRYGNVHESAMHNSYMLALVEGGVLLLVPYLVLFYFIWRDLGAIRARAAAAPDLKLGWLADALRLTLLTFLLFSAFADTWHEIYIFLFTGLTVVLARIYRSEPAA